MSLLYLRNAAFAVHTATEKIRHLDAPKHIGPQIWGEMYAFCRAAAQPTRSGPACSATAALSRVVLPEPGCPQRSAELPSFRSTGCRFRRRANREKSSLRRPQEQKTHSQQHAHHRDEHGHDYQKSSRQRLREVGLQLLEV